MKATRVGGAMVAAVVVILSLAACQPNEGKVVMVGDSTAWLASWYGADWRGAETQFTLGARANNPPGNHQGWVEGAVNDPVRSPEVLVMIYGHNYVNTGMSLADQQELGRMVHTVMDNTGCVVLVLPAYVGTDANHTQQIQDYRAWASYVAGKYPQGVTLVDWQLVAEAYPQDWTSADGSPTDGIHIGDQADGTHWSDAVNQGVDVCAQKANT